MKYIIKNCPNFIAEYMFFDPCKCEKSSRINGVYQGYCKDINDCLLKQIVELCKSHLDLENFGSSYFLAEDIVELLEIEEVNE